MKCILNTTCYSFCLFFESVENDLVQTPPLSVEFFFNGFPYWLENIGVVLSLQILDAIVICINFNVSGHCTIDFPFCYKWDETVSEIKYIFFHTSREEKLINIKLMVYIYCISTLQFTQSNFQTIEQLHSDPNLSRIHIFWVSAYLYLGP